VQTLISRIINQLGSEEFAAFCAENKITLAILFGSQVRGAAREDSDIDLAILLETACYPKSTLDAGKLKREIARKLYSFLGTSKVDLVFLNRAAPFMRFQVARTGKPVFAKSAAEFVQFASLALRQHEDARLFYQLESRYLQSELN